MWHNVRVCSIKVIINEVMGNYHNTVNIIVEEVLQ